MASHRVGIRARLLNTSSLEGTNLVLYTINETDNTPQVYKDDVRRDEIRMLLQGLLRQITSDALPPHPHQYRLTPSLKQRTPVAKPPSETDSPAPLPASVTMLLQLPAPVTLLLCLPALLLRLLVLPPHQGLQAWRHKRLQEERKSRKVYSCRVCGNPMNSEGHA